MRLISRVERILHFISLEISFPPKPSPISKFPSPHFPFTAGSQEPVLIVDFWRTSVALT